MFAMCMFIIRSFFFFSSRRRHTRFDCDWSSDVCSSDLIPLRRGYKGVGAFGSFVRIRTILHRMAVKYAGAGRHRDRIIHLQSTALRAQGFADPDRTRLADIVRVRFEGEAQDADGLVGEASKALPN